VSVERIFAGWSEPLLHPVSRLLTERYDRFGVVDLRSVDVVVPGARAGRRLKELLLDLADAAGSALLPPTLLTSGDLPELFYRPPFPLASALLARRVWSDALRGLDTDDLATLFGPAPEPADIRGWDLLGDEVLRLQRETAGGGHTFADVGAVCAGGDMLFDDGERWLLLERAQREYRSRLSDLGFADADLERLDALGRHPEPRQRDTWLVGIADLPLVARTLVSRTTGRVVAVIHAPNAESESFDSVGCVLPGAWASRTIPLSGEHIRIVDRPSDQGAAVHAAIVEDGVIRTADVVIGLTDPGLRASIEEWMEEAAVPLHFAAGEPVTGTGCSRLLSAVADYLERPDWDAFSSLIRHPHLERHLERHLHRIGGGGRVGYLDAVDRYHADHLPLDLSSRIPGGDGVVAGLRRHLNDLLAPLKGARPLNRWPGTVFGVLRAVYGDAALDTRLPATRAFVGGLEALRDIAMEIDRLPAGAAPRVTGAAAIRMLLDLARALTVPDEPDLGAIDLVGWLELPLDDAPAVVVAGVNEPGLPESVNADSFLPDGLRARLGLVDNARRYARDAFHLTALVHSRRRLTLIAGRRGAGGDPLRLSRLLMAATGETLARRVLDFTATGGEEVASPSPRAARAGSRSYFRLPPEPVLGFAPPPVLSVTAFRSILEDPYRFVLESRLGLRSADDSARELDGLAFGRVAHAVLQRFGRTATIRSPDEREISRVLSELLREEADRTFGDAAVPAVRLQLELLAFRLTAFARWQAGRVREGWQVVLVEGEAAGDDGVATAGGGGITFEVPFLVDGEEVQLRGRIDRIDHHPETGAWAILDYKTGDTAETPDEVHRRSRGARWRDLQLPLYRHLAMGSPHEPLQRAARVGAALQLGYVLLCRDTSRIGLELAPWSLEELDEADEVAREAVRTLRRGVVEFRPGAASRFEDALAPLLGRRMLAAADTPAWGEEE